MYRHATALLEPLRTRVEPNMRCMLALGLAALTVGALFGCNEPQFPATFSLAEPGEYRVGVTTTSSADKARDDRPVEIRVWYPTAESDEVVSGGPVQDAAPDTNAAPYPVIVSSSKMGRIFAPVVVSHGFTWIGVDGLDTYPVMGDEAIDQPLDLLFALDHMGTSPPELLEGVIDANRAGAIGYSFDGYNTLAMSGARIDPEYYLAQCPTPDATTAAILSDGLSSFSCDLADRWHEFEAYAGDSITRSSDGLWQAMTDERIKAVMPMAAEGWWMFGERGLASVDRPVLALVATEDELYSENVLIFDHIGTREKTLISFKGEDHMMVMDNEMVGRMAHFATAFFGYHLQSREDYKWYFSEEFIDAHDDLAWGAVVDEGDPSR